MPNHSQARTSFGLEHIRLSIALVTRNRSDSLERTLKSLFGQNFPFFEVIISDDSDIPEAILSNKKLSEIHKCKYVTGPQKGLYANRNFVAKLCKGTHYRTMDDDHEFPQGHFNLCLQAILSDPNAIWVIGEYFAKDKNKKIPAPIPGQLHPRGYSFIPKNIDKYYGISCGASIYPISVITNNLLNQDCYKFGILFLEYGVRLYNNGYKIKPLLTTFIIHHYDESMRSITSNEIIRGAEIYSIVMFSFYHKRNLYNCFLTSFEILKGLISRKYSFKILLASLNNIKESK